jgi:pimeloyl-ACP methyl ester carboxylesterase
MPATLAATWHDLFMSDFLVVIPGIGGSQLAASDGTVLWNASWTSFAKQAASWGRGLERLTLSPGINDGVRATELIDGLTVIPGFWSYGSYAPLTSKLRQRFGAADVEEFAYDWRRSNDESAARLAEFIESRGVADQTVVLIAHSMGGIVARSYLTHYGGARRCRLLITLGTPFRGAVKAVDALLNGLPVVPGNFGRRLLAFLRSCPSVYELLPRYDCFEGPDAKRFGFDTWLPDGLDADSVRQAGQFHDEIDTSVAAGGIAGVDMADIGHRQETCRYATVTADKEVRLRPELWVGDGTVPEGSAKPPEWEGRVQGSLPFWTTHLDLASNDAIFRSVEGLISGRDFGALGAEDDDGLSLSLPDVAVPGEPVVVRVRTRDDRLTITAAEDDNMSAVARLIAVRGVQLGGDELVEYEGRIGPLGPGIHHVVVRAVAGGAPHQVSGAVTVPPDDDMADEAEGI